MARVCIVCHNECRGGYPVQDDIVMHTIRNAKKRFGVAQNNELMVDDGCFEEHRKKRERFERDLAMHAVFAAIVLMVFILLPIFSGSFSLASVFLGILLGCLIVGLSVLHYWPKTAYSPAKANAPAQRFSPPAILQKKEAAQPKQHERKEATRNFRKNFSAAEYRNSTTKKKRK